MVFLHGSAFQVPAPKYSRLMQLPFFNMYKYAERTVASIKRRGAWPDKKLYIDIADPEKKFTFNFITLCFPESVVTHYI